MDMVDRNFQVSEALIEILDKHATPKQQNELLQEWIVHWLYGNPNISMRDHCIVGVIDMEEISMEIDREFEAIDDELHRSIEY